MLSGKVCPETYRDPPKNNQAARQWCTAIVIKSHSASKCTWSVMACTANFRWMHSYHDLSSNQKCQFHDQQCHSFFIVQVLLVPLLLGAVWLFGTLLMDEGTCTCMATAISYRLVGARECSGLLTVHLSVACIAMINSKCCMTWSACLADK